MPPAPKEEKKKILCPECATETPLDEDGEGDCPKCGLPVGGVYKKRRIERALEKIRKDESEAELKPKKKSWLEV